MELPSLEELGMAAGLGLDDIFALVDRFFQKIFRAVKRQQMRAN